MGYNKITLGGNQICDFLYATKAEPKSGAFSHINEEPELWDSNTLFMANFDKEDLNPGNTKLSESIKGYKVMRRKPSESNLQYVGTVKNDQVNFIMDYMAANISSYIYYLYPDKKSDGQVVISPFKSNSVSTDWGYWSLIVANETEEKNVFYLDKMFKFEYNLEVGDINNNASTVVTKNFTRFPFVHQGASNYLSGDLSALCGIITCDDLQYTEPKDIVNSLLELTTDSKKKFLKDMHGNVWEVKITAPVNIAIDMATIEKVRTAKISWTQVGNAEGMSVINNPKFKPIVWLLTDSGRVGSYIQTGWNDDAYWEDSLIWTEQ